MPKRNTGTNGDVLTDAVKGAIAGAVGVWALDKVTWAIWDREARPGGLDPAHVIANRAAEAMGKELTPKQPHPAGIGVHYALGILPGAAYGVLRNRVSGSGAGGGLLYGLGLFLMQDEGLNPLLGTSGKPGEYPMEAHVRGLVGHMVLGLATHLTLNLLDEIA